MSKSIEVIPGQVHWMDDYRPYDLGEPCAHSCMHNHRMAIAWGPSDKYYEVLECWNCGCRSWTDISRSQTAFRMVIKE